MSTLYSKILIVDDEVEVCEALKEFFESQQFITETAHDGEDALSKVDEFKPHCILLDIKMPYLNGIEALGMIGLKDQNVEVIMVTAVSNIKTAEECMRNGAFGYVTKPIDLDYLLKEVSGALESRKRKLNEEKKKKEELDHLKEESLKFQKLSKTLNRELYLALIFPFKLIALSHPEFGCHSNNVAWLAKEIAEHMKLKFVWKAAVASYYHDVGKLTLPREIWGGISEEWDENKKKAFKKIPIWGQEIVQSHPELGALGLIIRHQFENVDGSGYPDGIAGEDIPLESRIIAVANAFDEILEKRNKRNIQQEFNGGEEVLEIIKKDVNKKYDASVVQAVCELMEGLKHKTAREKEIVLNELAPGLVLSRDVITQSGKLIISRNTILNPTLIDKIILLEKIDPIVSGLHVFESSEPDNSS